jgi:hypothetical protein
MTQIELSVGEETTNLPSPQSAMACGDGIPGIVVPGACNEAPNNVTELSPEFATATKNPRALPGDELTGTVVIATPTGRSPVAVDVIDSGEFCANTFIANTSTSPAIPNCLKREFISAPLVGRFRTCYR